MGRTERQALIRKIEEYRKSKLICYLTSDRPNLTVDMQKNILPIIDEHLRQQRAYPKIDVFIVTLGGDILTGFGLSRLLREYSKWTGALIPDRCLSAGTLFALGANEIVMTKRATLSPIDPSINRPLNPQAVINPQIGSQTLPLSVESVAGFKALAEEDWKLTVGDGLAEAFRNLAEKVHPLALGDVFRTRQQIQLLAKKLLNQHREDEAKIGNIIETLTQKLGSHDYLIYRTEAKDMMGDQVQTDDSLEDLIFELYRDFAKDLNLGKAYLWKQTLYDAAPTAVQHGSPALGQILRDATVDLQTVIIESNGRTDAFEERCRFVEHITSLNHTLPVTSIHFESPYARWNSYTT